MQLLTILSAAGRFRPRRPRPRRIDTATLPLPMIAPATSRRHPTKTTATTAPHCRWRRWKTRTPARALFSLHILPFLPPPPIILPSLKTVATAEVIYSSKFHQNESSICTGINDVHRSIYT